MPRFDRIGPKSPGLCLLVALGFGSWVGCERDANGPQESEAASRPARAAATFVVPKLSDETRNELPNLLVAKIDSAYQDASAAPDDPVPLGALAALYYVHGFADEAARCFEWAAGLKPDEMPWCYSAGLAYEKAERPAEAQAAFERALAFGRDYGPLYVHLADLLIEDDPARAAKLYQQALAASPASASAHYGLGRIAAIEGRRDLALNHLHRAIGLAPDYADAHRAAAEILSGTGQQAEAQVHLRRAAAGSEAPLLDDPVVQNLRRRGLDPAVLCSDAMLLAQQGQFDRAEALITQALQLERKQRLPHLTLGALRGIQKRYAEAVAEFQAVLEVEPDSLEAKSSLAQAYADSGESEQAERLFREVLAQQPDHRATLLRFARLMSVLGRADEPVRLMREALQSDPQNEVLHLRLGQILVMANRTAEALEHVRQAIALRPEFLAARRALALALEQSGDWTGAAAQWEEILQAYPGLEEGYLQLARVLDELKDTPRMARILRQGLERSPNAHQLANALAWILAASADQKERNGQEAVEWAEKACALTNHQNPIYLDTLGVAYAEAGRFEDAVRVGRKAVELATAARNAAQAEKYRRRVELYEWKQPYHESD